MRTVAFALACFGCADEARRVHRIRHDSACKWELENIASHRAGELHVAEFGMANLKKTMNDPVLLSEVAQELRQLEGRAELVKLMANPRFQAQARHVAERMRSSGIPSDLLKLEYYSAGASAGHNFCTGVLSNAALQMSVASIGADTPNPEFVEVPCPTVHPQPLAPLAEVAAQLLTERNETITVFDATAGGLIQASLLARPGASKYVTCAANTISTRRSVQLLGESLVTQLKSRKSKDAASYQESKRTAVMTLARQMRAAVGATWCIAESGACGPTFPFPGIEAGFTAIYVSGPVERAVWVKSVHADREKNMWGFTKAALDLLAACLQEASSKPPVEDGIAPTVVAKAFEFKEDRFAGVNIDIPASSEVSVAEFTAYLKSCLEEWSSKGKRGIWFKLPLSCGRFVAALTAERFKFHHAQEEYVMLTRWLEDSPSKLPRYGFTQIGVGGCVVNSKDEVLMIQERSQAGTAFQGLWKLPGGLADPGEDLAVAVGREVLEETGISTELVGVVSMRHKHGVRFGQSDIYCVVRLRALTEEINIDPEEVADARWMSLDEISKRVPVEKQASMSGCISSTTCKVIQEALTGALIQGTLVPSTAGKSTMMYTAAPLSAPPRT